MVSGQARLLGDSSHVERLLTRHLPYTLPVLRRLQLGHRNPSLLVLIAGLEDHEIVHYAAAAEHMPDVAKGPWTVGVIDCEHRPGTECWVFSSLELEPVEQFVGKDAARAAKRQLLSIFNHISKTRGEAGLTEGEAETTSLVGTVNSRVAEILASYGLDDSFSSSAGSMVDIIHAAAIRLANGIFINRISPAYGKYVYPASSVILSEQKCKMNSGICDMSTLPDGLIWSLADDRDYDKIMSLNSIVQSPALLKNLPSCVLRRRDTGQAVAWGFLDIDGSVRTVHVEPEYRKRGLAARMLRRLLYQHREVLEKALQGDEHLYLCADIKIENAASLALFNGIGAKHLWDVVWVTVDLDRVREECQRWAID